MRGYLLYHCYRYIMKENFKMLCKSKIQLGPKLLHKYVFTFDKVSLK